MMTKAEIIEELEIILNTKYDDEFFFSVNELQYKLKQEPKTNREKINEMSNEELARILYNHNSCRFCNCKSHSTECNKKSCTENIKEWLETETKEE